MVGKVYKGILLNLSRWQQRRAHDRRAGLGWLRRKWLKHQTAAPHTHTLPNGLRVHYTNGPELLHGLEEIFVDEIYRANLPPKPYILDCGANIGLSALYLLSQHPDAELEAFEPDPANFALLQQNTTALRTSALRLHQAAVWTDNGEVAFAAEGTMGGKIGEEGTTTVRVPARRLRDLLTRPVALLKIDIEGAEHDVLRDIADRLDVVQNMFVEYHGSFAEGSKLTDILALAAEAGFSCYLREAARSYTHPFARPANARPDYDVQLNLFFFRS